MLNPQKEREGYVEEYVAEEDFLVGAFNPSEKYASNWNFSPGRDEHKKIFELPPPRLLLLVVVGPPLPGFQVQNEGFFGGEPLRKNHPVILES